MKLTVVAFVSLIGVALAANGTQYAPVIQLKDGKVRGIVEEVSPGHNVHSYIGIRYGRAKRFEKPTAVEPWNDTYEAVKWRDACPQSGIGQTPFQTNTTSEDCLFLTVKRPEQEKANRSVMVWIHGGGYNEGTIFTFAYDGRYLASLGDVIVVTVNYRLGPFGFLANGDSANSGNNGLFDVLLALKWVQENIKHFGGDPNLVTLFGESAGSFAVSSMILAPQSKGLFHRAIMQSGAVSSYYGIQTREQNNEVTKWLASRLNCTGETFKETVTCIKGRPVQQIVDSYKKITSQDQNYKPIYNTDLLPTRPVDALRSGKFTHDIDLMFGVTSHEGSGFVFYLSPEIHSGQHLTINSTQEAIKSQMSFFKVPFAAEVAHYYTSKLHNPTQDELKLAIADSFGDFHLACPTILFAEEFAKTVQLLSPKKRFFSYRLDRATRQLNCTGWMSVCHAEDIFYLFAVPAINSDPELAKQSHDMLLSWSSFAKTGHPGKMGTVEWSEAFERPHTVTSHMSLDVANYHMVHGVYQQVCDAFWKPKIFV